MLTYWRQQYGDLDGPDKIAARRELNYCLDEGVSPIDFDQLAYKSLKAVGVGERATILDIGCSFPFYLEAWKMARHKGHLIGVDPNSEQFNGLPFWQPLGKDREYERIRQEGDPEKLSAFYERIGKLHTGSISGIELISAPADFIPLSDNEADVVSWMFSAYAIAKEKQEASFEEAYRVQKEDGIHVIATSAGNNKEGIRENEAKIAAALTEQTGVEFLKPIPINAGFTSEDAVERMAKDFNHVWVFPHRQKMVFDSPRRHRALLKAYMSFRDGYLARHDHAQIPTTTEFEMGLMAVVGTQIAEAYIDNHGRIEDTLAQDLVFASDRVLKNVPKIFKRLQ